MFAKLFRRAEASVDNAIGDLFNRVVVAVLFLIAFGFAAASLRSLSITPTGRRSAIYWLPASLASWDHCGTNFKVAEQLESKSHRIRGRRNTEDRSRGRNRTRRLDL